MLQTAAPFPYPGSLAQLDGEVVKIRERAGDTALVFGPSITRRVPVADLAPPPEPSLFDRWRAERLVTGDASARTLTCEVYADYRAWIAACGFEAAYPITEYAFERAMLLAGHGLTRGFWREPGDRAVRTRRLYPVALRSGSL